MNLPLNQIICGDCLEVIKTFPDNSIDLVVTSPPYDNLRDYKGYSFNFEGIAQQLTRVLRQGGVIVWVVGDSMIDGSESCQSFKQAIYFRELGLNLHDTMIYKKNGIGFPNPKRYHQCFEYMFIFSCDIPKTVNLIEDRKNSRGNEIKKNRWERQNNGKIKFRDKEEYKLKEWGARWNIWEYEIGYNKTTKYTPAFIHPAMFPEALAQDHILSWSNPTDIVLDPFNGSGTTCVMAKNNNRNYIGIDISSEYCPIAEQRLLNVIPDMFLTKPLTLVANEEDKQP